MKIKPIISLLSFGMILSVISCTNPIDIKNDKPKIQKDISDSELNNLNNITIYKINDLQNDLPKIMSIPLKKQNFNSYHIIDSNLEQINAIMDIIPDLYRKAFNIEIPNLNNTNYDKVQSILDKNRIKTYLLNAEPNQIKKIIKQLYEIVNEKITLIKELRVSFSDESHIRNSLICDNTNKENCGYYNIYKNKKFTQFDIKNENNTLTKFDQLDKIQTIENSYFMFLFLTKRNILLEFLNERSIIKDANSIANLSQNLKEIYSTLFDFVTLRPKIKIPNAKSKILSYQEFAKQNKSKLIKIINDTFNEKTINLINTNTNSPLLWDIYNIKNVSDNHFYKEKADKFELLNNDISPLTFKYLSEIKISDNKLKSLKLNIFGIHKSFDEQKFNEYKSLYQKSEEFINLIDLKRSLIKAKQLFSIILENRELVKQITKNDFDYNNFIDAIIKKDTKKQQLYLSLFDFRKWLLEHHIKAYEDKNDKQPYNSENAAKLLEKLINELIINKEISDTTVFDTKLKDENHKIYENKLLEFSKNSENIHILRFLNSFLDYINSIDTLLQYIPKEI
ncbi:hypothetical protein RRG44_03365 [Mycoplasmopsis cynos]|uniref:hypothetical protein n=1 Tax=Mycoplasmopsis cynos TaxID=171284 RepID=UPI002AFF0DA1|nr:hypothetical protein [Mycoplasmopsis cynos]WQQ19128.1 hypothetical protein RRG44_03365 [Mycoplasmopsis cynos]